MAEFTAYLSVDMTPGHLGFAPTHSTGGSFPWTHVWEQEQNKDRSQNTFYQLTPTGQYLGTSFDSPFYKEEYNRLDKNRMEEYGYKTVVRKGVGRTAPILYVLEGKRHYNTVNYQIYGGQNAYSQFSDIEHDNISGYQGFDYEAEMYAYHLRLNDSLIGSSQSDRLYAFRGDDLIEAGGGDDFVHGGTGVDTAIYKGKFSQYSIVESTGIANAKQVSGREGSDTLVDVEKLRFADGILDIATNKFKKIRIKKTSKKK